MDRSLDDSIRENNARQVRCCDVLHSLMAHGVLTISHSAATAAASEVAVTGVLPAMAFKRYVISSPLCVLTSHAHNV